MHSDELAPNVDPTLRQYISLAIQEAIHPALNEVWLVIERLNAKTSQSPDTLGLEANLERTLADKLAPAIAALISSKHDAVDARLTSEFDSMQEQMDDILYAHANLRQLIDALDIKISKWANEDRYSITRAQVVKAMREARNDE